MTNCRPIDSPMDPNQKLMTDQGETYSDPKDIEDWLESSYISQFQDLTSLSQLMLLVNSCKLLMLIIGML